MYKNKANLGTKFMAHVNPPDYLNEDKRPTKCPECNGPMDKIGRIYTPLDKFLQNPTLPVVREACKPCADRIYEEQCAEQEAEEEDELK